MSSRFSQNPAAPGPLVSVEWTPGVRRRAPIGRVELRRLVAGLARELFASHAASPVHVRLLAAGDAELADLNLAHAGLRGPTNVLAFPDDLIPGSGDVAVSMDAVNREARLYGQPVRLHLSRLLAHALLHLRGMEHGQDMHEATEAAARRAVEGIDGRTALR